MWLTAGKTAIIDDVRRSRGRSEYLFSAIARQRWTHVQLWTDMAGDSETPPPRLQDDLLGTQGPFCPHISAN